MHQQLQQTLEAVITDLYGVQLGVSLTPSQSDDADVQTTVAMSLAGRLQRPAADLAQEIVTDPRVLQGTDKAYVSGNSPKQAFINLRFNQRAFSDLGSSLAQTQKPLHVVVDYSGPNVAKNMHVGHLRSTIIGDAIANLYEAQGHTVTRQNHLGDWGTQFGMLVEHITEQDITVEGLPVEELAFIYKAAKKRFDSEPEFADSARQRVVLLQSGDEDTLHIWKTLVECSIEDADTLYNKLDVSLTADDIRGESFYNDELEAVVKELMQAQLVSLSDGALVFEDNHDAPLIVRKQDGGYGYATTDLAAIKYRMQTLAADIVIYVTDARQKQHFSQVFNLAAQAGWARPEQLIHVSFGMVLDEKGKPFKSREGTPVTLNSLIDAATAEAHLTLEGRGMNETTRDAVAGRVAIAAIKYADLSSSRIKDYQFNVQRMVSFQGDTGPYLQYAQRRATAVLEKAADQDKTPGQLNISNDYERALALHLDLFSAAINSSLEHHEPHRLCTYLHKLATAYSTFYENCPILTADDTIASSRLLLCQLTADVLAQGLSLLGIRPMRIM